MGKQNGKRNPGKGGGKYEGRNPAKVADKKPCLYDKVTSNDISYYNKNQADFAAATQVPWISYAGDDLRIDSLFLDHPNSTWPSMPGISVIRYYHGPGYAALSDDAVNRAFTVLMGNLYVKTASHQLPFASDDLARFVIGQTSNASLFATAKRVLESVGFWVNRNYAYPKAIIKAYGFDYDDIVTNFPSYKIRLNQLIQAFNNLKIPAFVDTFKRQYALAHNVYLDEDSPLGQIYVWTPANYYIYRDTDSKLESVDMPTFANFGEFLDVIDNVVKTWYGSQDLYLINGTLQRVFSDTEFVAVAQFNDESIEPVVDNVMMQQLMNCTITGELTNLDVTGDPLSHTVFWKPRSSRVYPQTTGWLLRAYNGSPSADDNMEMTRFVSLHTTVVVGDDESSVAMTEFEGCSPELIKEIAFYAVHRKADGSVALKQVGLLQSNYIYKITGTWYNDDVNTIVGMQPFRYLPPVFLVEALDGGTNDGLNYVYGMLGDQYNYTILSRAAWEDLQKVALFSMYSVPAVNPGLNI